MLPNRFRYFTEEEEPEVTQEGMFEAGFNNLRSKLSQAIGDRFKISNVFKGMNGKDKFDVTSEDEPDIKTSVESTGTGCNVITRGDGKMKSHFRGLSLSRALDSLIQLFEKPELLLENALYMRFDDSVYMEADEESVDDLNDTIDEIEDELHENDDSSDDENSSDKDDDDNDLDIDISVFGTDDSDIQNEYDPKEVDRLNQLIASENDAMGEYFEAGKNTNDENLRRLFADIGSEERFHAEQLIYAKCTLTGEKYEPRDPEVKKEYEELVAMGMDEDTAASTAIDKSSMTGNDDGDDSDMEELEQEAAILETMLTQNEFITLFCESFDRKDMNNAVNVFIEAYIQETVDNVSQMPKEFRKATSPVKILSKGLRASINGLIRLAGVIRDSVARSRIKNTRKIQWIKKHGIGDLFKDGISLYFYDDNKVKVDMDSPALYVDLLYRLTCKIGENCGIRLTAAGKHKPLPNPIRFGSISEGLNKLKQVVFTPTKIVITDKNKDALTREFFGYSDQKLAVNVTRGDEGQTVRDSNNIYSRLNALILITKQYCDISVEVLDRLEGFEGDTNSIYYKNREMYNKAVSGMKLIVDKYNQFIKAMAHDLKIVLSLDNGLLKMTQERDMAEQHGGKFEGPDVRTSGDNTLIDGKSKGDYARDSRPKRVPNKW